MVKKKTCIFISGKGSNLKNLNLTFKRCSFPIKISLVISNNKNANGLNYAKKYQIPYLTYKYKKKNYENKILLNLKKYKISFICLAGYMKIISKKINKKLSKKNYNIHPLFFQNLKV